MWQDRYDKNSFFHLFHTCHPKVEQKLVLGTLLDCVRDHHKVTRTLCTTLDRSDGTTGRK